MDRREFLGSAIAATSVSLTQVARNPVARTFVIENKQIAWHLETSAGGIHSTGFDNRITRRRFALKTENEFTVVLSAAAERLEIPWWDFRFTDEGTVAPDQESGLRLGFHQIGAKLDDWQKTKNLAGRTKPRIYGGYGWFRHHFELPASAKGKEIVFILGGYDQQDWNEHWVYVNGKQIGHRTAAGRWRTPGRHVVAPSDPLYASLRFGPGNKNLLAVRAHEYNFHFGDISKEILERVVFRPFLFDQFISVGEPYLRVSKFELQDARQDTPEKITFSLRNAEHQIDVAAHYELNGFVRRKWLEIRNQSKSERLLLDVELDDYQTEGESTDGGHGEPVFLDGEAFFAVEHPAGINRGEKGRIRLWHCPGRKIAAGEAWQTQTAIAAVTPRGQSIEQFHQYLQARSPRTQKKLVSIYTSYGINNQWGGCGTLSDIEVLDCQRVVRRWQEKGVKLDYFTMDTGWPQNDGDLTEFVSTCYPDGPAKIVEGVQALGMKFGLWFSVSWGGWSNGSYPAVQASAIPEAGSSNEPPTEPPVAAYRNGYPISGGVGRQMCIASEPFFRVFRDAVLHHVRENKARLVKFDSGNYYCNSTAHGHLPGKYSTEAMFDHLIDIARQGRAIAPDLFVTWYWGAGSPFWALHGDVISESGLFMEGSGTSWYPTLYYRDSVTLSLDQNTQFAKLIPSMNKDSIGVWLSQIRWANFMGKERWREALIMDLGRGNLVFPQLWGDPNLLSDDDLKFLSEIVALARDNEAILLKPRRTFGDAWKNEVYGYTFFDGTRGFIFCNNTHFTSRKLRLPLDAKLGLSASSAAPLQAITHFPERAELEQENGSPIRSGDALELWMRPFETLLLEIGPEKGQKEKGLLRRRISASEAAQHGTTLTLTNTEPQPWMDLKFADAARFEKASMRPAKQCFSSRLPALSSERSILAIHIKLTKNGEEYRYLPVVVEIAQIRCRVGGRNIQLVPIPDARRYGNTQSAGCSWVLYKVPLTARHSEKPLEFAVHTYLPPGVEAHVEAWLTKQWWKENSRPEADGYYGDAPS